MSISKTLFTIIQLLVCTTLFSQWTTKGGIEAFCGESGAAIEVDLSNDGNIRAYADEGFNNRRGVVRISRWENESWQPLGEDGIQGQIEGHTFGRSISLNSFGNVIAIADGGSCCSSEPSINAVYVYQFDGSSWVLRGDRIEGTQSTSNSGVNVVLSGNGNKLVFSEPTSDLNGANSGIVRTFEWDGSSWEQSMDAIIGQNDNSRIGELLSLSKDGSTLAMSDYKNANSEIILYEAVGQNWVQKGNALPGNFFNEFLAYPPWQNGEIKLSLNGDLVIVGAPNFAPNSSTLGGEVRVYEWNGFIWSQRGGVISSTETYSSFGSSVDMSSDGTIISIGVPHTFINAPSDFDFDAFVRLYRWDGTNYLQLGNDILSAMPNIRFGLSNALSEDGLNIFISTEYKENDCNNYSQVYFFDDAVSTTSSFYENLLNVFPNPFYSEICIDAQSIETELFNIYLYNVNGQIVYNEKAISSSNINYCFTMDGLTKGIYFIRVTDMYNNIFMKRLIKNGD